MKVTNSYSAPVFPSIFNCGDFYCNCGHLSSRPGQDAKQRPLWVKKHPSCKGRLKNVRGSLGRSFACNFALRGSGVCPGEPSLWEASQVKSTNTLEVGEGNPKNWALPHWYDGPISSGCVGNRLQHPYLRNLVVVHVVLSMRNTAFALANVIWLESANRVAQKTV